MLRHLTLCAAFVLSLVSPAWADDFYVNSYSGDDSNAGTAAAPFKTLAKGVGALQSNHNDRLLITGVWSTEPLSVARDRVSIIGLGAALIRDQPVVGVATNGSGIYMENIAIYGCYTGLQATGVGHLYRRMCVRNCVYGQVGWYGLTNSRFVECDFLGNNNIGFLDEIETYVTYERCTSVSNGDGCLIESQHNTIRNCIFAYNTVVGIFTGNGTPFATTLDYNLVFANGDANGTENYSPPAYQGYPPGTPGPHDLQQVDPQFVDFHNLNVALKRTSPALNAGADEDGLPVTIGAHQIGTLSSSGAAASVAFSSWTDANGTSVTAGGAQITLGADGYLHLASGVQTAAALAPVMDLGDVNAIVTNATFQAIQDFTQPPGSRQQVSLFEIRVSANPFNALDASPAWQTITTNQVLNLAGRYAQLRVTLTSQGQ